VRAQIKRFVYAAILALMPMRAAAQSVDFTRAGHELNGTLSGYTYVEPGTHSISIKATKFGGEYAGTLLLSKSHTLFAQADVRGLLGNTTYTGFCSPWFIKPNSGSPNGYELDLGAPSPCSESGDNDWYVEGRAVVGKDFISGKWGWSPRLGLGVRHLSNGTTGIAGYRTDHYLYVPLGITARTTIASNRALSFRVEYDHLLHGWQNTHDSRRGGGDVPATAIAPAFTIDGFSDISFDQHSGWALRAGATYQMTRRWSVSPEYIHWNVGASPVNFGTARFTVNRITARQQIGFYEPLNTTDEFVVKLGFRF